MPRRLILPLLLLVGLSLSGCAIGDGIAHLVKKTSEQFQGSKQSTAGTPPAVASDRAPPPPDPSPPPPPAAATRDSVSVESLPSP